METRAQDLLKEAAVCEVEETWGSRIEQMLARTHALEGTVANQNKKIDKNIVDMFEAIRLLSVNKGNASTSEERNIERSSLVTSTTPVIQLNNSKSGRGRSGMQSIYSSVTRLAKLYFPRFNGDKIREWLFKVKQFFSIGHTPEELKVGIAYIHFDDLAATLHQSLVQSELERTNIHDWHTYKSILMNCWMIR